MIMDWAKEARFFGFTAGTSGAAATVSGPDIDGRLFDSFYAAAYIEATATGTTLKCLVGSATDSFATTPAESSGRQGSIWLNVHRPSIAASSTAGSRYVKFQLNTTGAAGNSVLGVWGYNSRVSPITNTTAVHGNSYYGTAT